MSLSERLKAARLAAGLKQEEMGAKSGVPPSSYQKYELGRSLPGSEAIEGFVRAGINANWLLTGEGPMLLSELEEARARLDQVQAERDDLRARVDLLAAELAAARAGSQGINAAAMRAIIVGTIEGQKAYNSPPEHIARLAVDFYCKAVADGLITATGIGEGKEKAA